MAGFRRKWRRPFRRAKPRRSRVDVVPFILCHDGLVIPQPQSGFYSCLTPFIQAIPLARGGARDWILREAANAAGDFTAYYQQQGMERGLSWLGAKFQHTIDYFGNPQVDFAIPAPGSFANFRITIASAIVRLEEAPDPVTGLLAPTTLPNLWSRDELKSADILYRWKNDLYFWVGDDIHGDFVNYTASTNGYQGTVLVTDCEQCWQLSQSGAPNQPRNHTVRNRRFLDETHGIYLVNCVTIPYTQTGTVTFGQDIMGVQKARGR